MSQRELGQSLIAFANPHGPEGSEWAGQGLGELARVDPPQKGRMPRRDGLSSCLALDYLSPVSPAPIIFFITTNMPRQTLSVLYCFDMVAVFSVVRDHLEINLLHIRTTTIGHDPQSGTCGRHLRK